jgi:hypothetical protein
MNRTCETCAYGKWTGSPYRECRRRAPITLGEQRLGGINHPVWPTVKADDGCGEWEANPTPPPEPMRWARWRCPGCGAVEGFLCEPSCPSSAKRTANTIAE